jgi:biotin carboxyl carrier protein
MRRQILFLDAGEGETREILVENRGSLYKVADGKSVAEAEAARLPDGRISLLFPDGRQLCGRGLSRGRDGVDVAAGSSARRVPLAKARPAAAGPSADADGGGGVEEVRALMHGRIVEICVSAGDRVEAGAILLVLEAMKMQNEIRASRGGTVERANVAPGQTVEGGVLMISIRSDNN